MEMGQSGHRSEENKRRTESLLIFLGRSGDQDYYLPLREAVVTEVSDHGPFVVIRYRLGRFVDLTEQSHEYATKFDMEIRRVMGSKNVQTGHTGHLVFPFDGIDVSYSTKEVDDDHNWANMVREIDRSKVFSASVFLRFHGLVEDENGTSLDMNDGQFLIKSGQGLQDGHRTIPPDPRWG